MVELAKYLQSHPCPSAREPRSNSLGDFYFNIDESHSSTTTTAMLLPRLQPPLRAALTSIARSATGGTQTACLNEAFAQLAIRSKPGSAGGVRWASHKAQGAVNKAKDGPGKRLGAKKSGGENTRSFNSLH